ncbi:hypothetical protein [Dyadobacter sp. CY356]|uniref:hypothetical protein n=1 Tax=Dyadobacter sp. CY356 TaxID=2906442 RepID=UPI001F43F2FC|nr:hypothetical protein [Dyadobacter sp. CY356]MCF0054980.1 hypothetical protein [Dyadobacter sp. CY356]
MQTIRYNIRKTVGNALTELRKQKHQSGYPFMVIDKLALPDSQAFMEYQDGKVEIVEFTGDYNDYHLVEILNEQEAVDFRLKYNLD